MKKTTRKNAVQIAQSLSDALALEKQARREGKEARAAAGQLLDAFGVDTLQCGDYIITREKPTRKALNQKRLKEERPEIVEAYTEPQTFTRWSVNQ